MNRAWGTGTTTSQNPTGRRRWTVLASVLAGGLLLAPAVAQAFPVRLPLAQEEPTGAAAASGVQVIAQGISRLPKGDVAWAVRRFEVPGEVGTAVESFPLGFALADGAEVALLDEKGGVLSLLEDGEAAFLPSGKAGALASWQGDAANLFEVALVSGEDAAAGNVAGTVVGQPFPQPEGRTFEIELARETLSTDEEATVPSSRSGAPTLFLMTRGTVQLTPPGGQPVELAAGQYALLASEVVARGSSADPAAFVVAAIGESTGARGAAAEGTPGARVGRNRDRNRNRDRASAGGGGGGQSNDRAARRAARQAARAARQQQGAQQGGGRTRPSREERRAARQQQGGGGGQGGQTQQPGTQPPVSEGGTGTPVAGTPTPVEGEQGTTPQPTVPVAGTPSPTVTLIPPATPPATPPAGETVVQDDTQVVQDDTDVVQDDTIVEGQPTAPVVTATPEGETITGESIVPTTSPQTETTLPVAEVPVEDVPAADVPVEQAPVEQAPVEQAPVEQVPADDIPAPAEQPPVEQAPAEQVPVEQAPPVEGVAEQPVDPNAGAAP